MSQPLPVQVALEDVTAGEALVVNVQQTGFYRVNYDDNTLFSSPGGKTLFQRVNTIYERGSKLVQIDVNLQGPGTLVSISPSHALCYKVPGPPRRGGFALKY